MATATLERPTKFSIADEPLLIYQETEVGSGRFDMHRSLVCDQISQFASPGKGGRIGRARLHFVLGAEIGVLPEQAMQLSGERRIAIGCYGGGDQAHKWQWLFDGYPVKVLPRWTGVGPDRKETVGVVAESIAVRYANAPECQIYGQWRTVPAEDDEGGEGEEQQTKYALIETLPCIFNHEGLPK